MSLYGVMHEYSNQEVLQRLDDVSLLNEIKTTDSKRRLRHLCLGIFHISRHLHHESRFSSPPDNQLYHAVTKRQQELDGACHYLTAKNECLQREIKDLKHDIEQLRIIKDFQFTKVAQLSTLMVEHGIALPTASSTDKVVDHVAQGPHEKPDIIISEESSTATRSGTGRPSLSVRTESVGDLS